jgi:hypothetical protein
VRIPTATCPERVTQQSRCSTRALQRGQAVLLLVLMLGVGVTIFAYGTVADVSRLNRADKNTRVVLMKAKEALIARALSDLNRPGSFPCPDAVKNNLNDANDGIADAASGDNCPSYIGRLPWRTLGTDDLRDDHGERLWYALSPAFRDTTNALINSTTTGNRTVYSGTSILTDQAVAIIFAPGAPLQGQNRSPVDSAACSAPLGTLTQNLCASNYLETLPGSIANNASLAGPYLQAPKSAQFNDQVAVITHSEFMGLVERRVGVELQQALTAFRNTAGYLPWPDSDGDGLEDIGHNHGRVATHGSSQWATYVNNALPYFRQNRWGQFFYYAVARNSLLDASKCDKCVGSETLSLDGASGFAALFITPGFQLAPRNTWPEDYIDDAENRNANGAFITPTSALAHRDGLYSVLGNPGTCSTYAHTLWHNRPCGWASFVTNKACVEAGPALASSQCSCAAAAAVFLVPPCVNNKTADGCRDTDPAALVLKSCG